MQACTHTLCGCTVGLMASRGLVCVCLCGWIGGCTCVSVHLCWPDRMLCVLHFPLRLFRPCYPTVSLMRFWGKGCWYFNPTVNQTTALPSMLLKPRVDWLAFFMGWSEPLCLFPFEEPGLCINTVYFSTQTEWTARRLCGAMHWPLQKVYWVRIVDLSFNNTLSLSIHHCRVML